MAHKIVPTYYKAQDELGAIKGPNTESLEFSKRYADCIFEEVKKLNWLTERSARKEYFMSTKDREYSYGNRHQGDITYKSEPFSFLVREYMEYINHTLKTELNVCFLNRYEDHQQHLGWHADEFPGMREDQPIAVMSLGAEREIWWKEKSFKGIIPPENKQLLEHGSVWIMPPGFQDVYFHKIPKHGQPCGIRISLTFRSFVD